MSVSALILSALQAITPPSSEAAIEIRLVANAGVLVTQGETSFLIDGIFSGQAEENYEAPSSEIVDAILAGTGDYSGLDFVFVTNNRADHFDAGLMEHFIESRPNIPVTMSDYTVAMAFESRAWGPQPADFLDDDYRNWTNAFMQNVLAIEEDAHAPMNCLRGDAAGVSGYVGICESGMVVWLRNDEAFQPSIGFIFDLNGVVFAHLGDVDPMREQWWLWERGLIPQIDVIIYPYWFQETEVGRNTLETRFGNAQQIAVHFPSSMSRDDALNLVGQGRFLMDSGDTVVIQEAAQ